LEISSPNRIGSWAALPSFAAAFMALALLKAK
jgi:hypothetical protein